MKLTAVVFDTESTGFNEGEVIEAAYQVLPEDINDRGVDEDNTFHARYRPSKPIELGALATHHILDTDLVDCEPSSSFEMPEVEYLIGHSVDYDADLVKVHRDVKRICTLALSRWLWPDIDSHSQTAMCYHLFGRTNDVRQSLEGAHSADIDVENCTSILYRILDELDNRGIEHKTWEDLYTWSEHARLEAKMSFGKYRGTKIKDLPADYIGWFLKQSDVDKGFERLLRKVQESRNRF